MFLNKLEFLFKDCLEIKVAFILIMVSFLKSVEIILAKNLTLKVYLFLIYTVKQAQTSCGISVPLWPGGEYTRLDIHRVQLGFSERCLSDFGGPGTGSYARGIQEARIMRTTAPACGGHLAAVSQSPRGTLRSATLLLLLPLHLLKINTVTKARGQAR